MQDTIYTHFFIYVYFASTYVYLVSCFYTLLNTCLVARFYICISCIYTCISRILLLHTLKHMFGGTFLYMYISYLASTHVYLVSCFYTPLSICLVARFYICISRILLIHTLKHMFGGTFLYMYISYLASTHVYLASCI
jgi:poly(3-hydroxyalkanoate) synthetase